MTDEQVGKYIKLLCVQHQKGNLTKEHMINICKSYDKDIFDKFRIDENGLYYNERLRIEIEKRSKYCESRRANRISANKDNHMSEHMSTHMLVHMENENENENININKDININILHIKKITITVSRAIPFLFLEITVNHSFTSRNKIIINLYATRNFIFFVKYNHFNQYIFIICSYFKILLRRYFLN